MSEITAAEQIRLNLLSTLNYDTAAAVAKTEALINGRFQLFRHALARSGALNGGLDDFIAQLERDFRAEQYLEQLADLETTCQRNLETARVPTAFHWPWWRQSAPRSHRRWASSRPSCTPTAWSSSSAGAR